uniref:G-protein coupled receptors family 1 profile domain-containing protein n=1 Tax=Oreochromis niloticus TaxID=8128 RepID=I3KZT3_ORENI
AAGNSKAVCESTMNSGVMICTLVEVLIAVSCCLGNMLVILALWTTKSIQQPTFCLIASLATADFLVGCVAIPLAVVVDGRVKTSFNMCLFISCVVILFTLVSVLSLLAISLDCFLRVYIPLRYKRIVTQGHSCLVVAACWIVAIPLSFTPMLGWYNHQTLSNSANSTFVCQFIAVIPMSYLVYFSRGAQKLSQNYLRKEKKLAGSLALVFALFVLCWLPLHIMNCIVYFGEVTNIPPIVLYIGIILSHANSAVNPVVYAFKIQKIKRAYLKIWRQCVSRVAENQESQTSLMTDKRSSSHIVSND